MADAMGREAAFLTGGEMGARMRAHDWSRSPIGPLEAWPAPLRMAASLMLNSAFPMFIAWGRELGFIYNDAYAEILGNKHPAALGCPFEVIWSEIWPDINPLIQRAMAGEATFSADLPLRMMRRGQYEDTWFTFSYSPVREEDGRVAGMFCCCVETTAGVRSQAELAELNIDLERQVTERSRERDRLWRNTQDIQVIIDGAGVFHAVNPAFTAILGWTPEDVIGRPVFDFVLPDDEALTSRALEHARVESLPVVENRYRHKNGGFRWISWVAAPEAKLIYASGRHITAEKEQAEALSRTEEALRQAQKMEAVGQLTGGLAHDFNNLLAGISGSLELMQTRMQQGRLTDVDRYMTAAQGAAKRAAALTHRLLAFSRRQTLDPKPTDVSRLAMGMHELIQRTVGPGILVEVVGATGAWPALVDPPQLENALLNLCINARDAMPDGGIITIETANKWMDERAARQHDMPEGQYLSLAVTDTGTGMPPEVVARAFDPFFTTKPIGEGTGLGLSMIYGFAQQSGGQVRIYSEVGQGTTVCIYLPRFYGVVEDDTAGEQIAELPRSEAGETVLVVDDEPTVRMLITDILEDLGYAAIEAGDSATGLKVLQSDVRIDLLVTDVGLPGGMNGRQMADAARNHRPDLKVLFITGYAENAILGNGMLPPGMAVLTKPFAMDNMAARIRSMIEAGRETRLQRRS
ncbi:PAS sensor protein [Methylorubrum extorquens PA1]|nr:PAS sensor protein [Methylorubrum extorquens PA1]